MRRRLTKREVEGRLHVAEGRGLDDLELELARDRGLDARACIWRSRRWRAMGTRRVDCVNASTLKKTDAGKDRRARACRRTARPRAAARRGPLCEYDCRGDGVFMGSSKPHARRPRPWDRSVTGTPPRKNDKTPGRDGATARDPRGRPERCEATTSAACAPSGPSPRRGRRRATGPTPPVWTAKLTPSTRPGSISTLEATESASSSSSSTNSAEGAAAGATASSRSRAARACRSRNSTPAASSAASAAHARLAHLRWSWLGAARR